MKRFKGSFNSKRISVIGCGTSGFHAALALRQEGARVFVSDKGEINTIYKAELQKFGIEFEENGHTDKIFQADLLVLSPGVKLDSPIIKRAETLKIPYVGELEIGYRLTEGYYIAITGTNGKSTVTSLIYEILKNTSVFKAGNIGEPLSKYRGTKGTFVLEVSSFQLKTIDAFRPDIAAILNVDIDHLDWHESKEDYIRAKSMIFKHQKKENILILNHDDEIVRNMHMKARAQIFYFSLLHPVKGAYLHNGQLILDVGKKINLLKISEMKLKGLHNVANVLAAALIAYLYGIEIDKMRQRIKEFKGLPHRVEFVLEKNGVKFYDDSKGTNPHSVKWALKGFTEPVVLIMGGEDKDLEFHSLRDEVKEHCKLVVAIGKAKEKIIKTFRDIVRVIPASDMEEAVRISYKEAKKGETVLLSPGCASFDMFKNYKERGDVYQYWVRKIAEEN